VFQRPINKSAKCYALLLQRDIKINLNIFAKFVKSFFSAVIRRKFHPTASQHWKCPPKVFPSGGGEDRFYGICGFFKFNLNLLFKLSV